MRLLGPHHWFSVGLVLKDHTLRLTAARLKLGASDHSIWRWEPRRGNECMSSPPSLQGMTCQMDEGSRCYSKISRLMTLYSCVCDVGRTESRAATVRLPSGAPGSRSHGRPRQVPVSAVARGLVLDTPRSGSGGRRGAGLDDGPLLQVSLGLRALQAAAGHP